ncbi:MAG: hypothetical protein AAFV38_11715 [Pseudomonadota bacterium]
MSMDGREIRLGGNPAKIGINPSMIAPTSSWLKFAPLTAGSMYRVRNTHLLDDYPALADQVER